MAEQLRVVLRPRALLESMDLALAFLGRESRCLLMPFTAAVLVAWALQESLDGEPLRQWIGVVLLTPLFERLATALLGSRLVGADVGLGGALRRAGAQPFSALGACLLPMMPLLVMLAGFERGDDELGATLIGAGAVVGMAWPFVVARWALTSTSAVLEGHGVGRALKRSSILSSHEFGRLTGFLVLSFCLRLAFVAVAEMAHVFLWGFVLQLGTPQSLGSGAGSSVVTLSAWIIAGMGVANFRLFEYVSLRIQTDAWDLQVRFRALAARHWGPRT
ncbi:MAG: hypothetical protein AAGD10_01055 [Myxococcota bacterium]